MNAKELREAKRVVSDYYNQGFHEADFLRVLLQEAIGEIESLYFKFEGLARKMEARRKENPKELPPSSTNVAGLIRMRLTHLKEIGGES